MASIHSMNQITPKITPHIALQNRLTESHARIMAAVEDLDERAIDKDQVQHVISKELLMLIQISERLIQLGAGSAAKEVHHGHS